jgi:putative alpha-1,2-mannosidase
LGAPIVPRVDLRVPGRQPLSVLCRNTRAGAGFRRTVAVNGRLLEGFHLPHEVFTKGGEVVFEVNEEK